MYLELELSIHGGGELPAPVQMELNWFMLEELVEHNLILEEEHLTYFAFLKILIILLKQQDTQDRLQYGVLSMNMMEFHRHLISFSKITMYHVLSATLLSGRQYS